MTEKPLSHYMKVPFLSASCSAFLSLIVYPLDLLNTVIKSESVTRKVKKVAIEIHQKSGIKGFYRGSTLIVYELFPTNFVYFFAYDYLNKSFVNTFDRNNIKSKWVIPIATSFLSEIMCLFIYVPLDTILTRMQAHHPDYQYKSVWDGIKSIYKNEGFLRFYYSSHLAISYCMIFTVLQYTNYEWFKAFYQKRTKKHEFGILESLLGTLYSTSIAVVLSNPIDTIFIQHQITNFEHNKHASTVKILRKEFSEYGLKVFVRNIGLRMTSLNAFAFATIPMYEFLRQKYGVDVEF